VSRFTDLNSWTYRFIERMLESVDADQISDFIDQSSEEYIPPGERYELALDVLNELENVKFTID